MRLSLCIATRNGTDCQLRATSLHLSTRLRCLPSRRRVCSIVRLQFAINIVRNPRSCTTTTSSCTAWQVIPHRLALTFSSATKAAILQHSPLRRAAPRPGARTCHYSTARRSNFQQLRCSPSRRVCSSTQLYHSSKSTLLHHNDHNNAAHYTTGPFDDAVSSARLSHHQKLHPSTNPPTLASASIVRARTPSPSTISSSIVRHNSLLHTRQPLSSFSTALCEAHNW